MEDHCGVERGREADNGQDRYQITEEGRISGLSTANISSQPSKQSEDMWVGLGGGYAHVDTKNHNIML